MQIERKFKIFMGNKARDAATRLNEWLFEKEYNAEAENKQFWIIDWKFSFGEGGINAICVEYREGDQVNDNSVPSVWKPNDKLINVETVLYDKEEIFTNCSVQVLTNTVTGETSIGWWKNNDDLESED